MPARGGLQLRVGVFFGFDFVVFDLLVRGGGVVGLANGAVLGDARPRFDAVVCGVSFGCGEVKMVIGVWMEVDCTVLELTHCGVMLGGVVAGGFPVDGGSLFRGDVGKAASGRAGGNVSGIVTFKT